MEEEKEEREESISEAESFAELSRCLVQKRYMNKLLESSAFKYLIERIDEQIKTRNYLVCSPPNGVDWPYKNAYAAGEIAGLRIARDLPSILIDYAQAQIDIHEAMREKKA